MQGEVVRREPRKLLPRTEIDNTKVHFKPQDVLTNIKIIAALSPYQIDLKNRRRGS
jgi:hypothetical protein